MRFRLPGLGQGRPSLRLAAWSLYGLWVALAYAALLNLDTRYLWHLPLLALAAVLLWRPQLLRPRRAQPTLAHYLLVSAVYAAFIGLPLALLGHGDLSPSLPFNSFLWLGSYVCVFVAWWLIARRYRLSTSMVVACAGLLGWLEPGLLVFRLAVFGGWQVLVLAPVLHVAYAALIAPGVNAYRELFLRDGKPPGALAFGLAVLLPAAGFYLGLTWIFLVRLILRMVTGA